MNAEISIRKAALDDAPALAEIHSRGWESAYAGIIPAETIAFKRTQRPAQWQAWVVRGDHEIYAAVLDGRLVGFVTMKQPDDHENLPSYYHEVGAIYLDPPVYRRGIGRQLMAYAEARARELGKSALMLWVFEDNAPSRRFYEACGYARDVKGEMVENEYGHTLRSLRYVKEI